ncbi:MAG TPA: hypothetical protein VF883_13260, partial [Thermoanaerobaculia bacterium]
LVAHADPTGSLEATQFLTVLWQEIRLLPLPQRTALLLQARDSGGESVTCLLPLAGIAGIDAIAEALEMAAESFVELWPRLPLDDRTIAGILGVTRQQVINLRQAARNRLSRRTGSAR